MNNLLSKGDEVLLKKAEVSARLSVCDKTVERMVSTGKLAKIKIRGAVRFRLSDVLSLMNGVTS